MSHPEFRLEIVATGNELLDGSIYDRHTQYVAQKLGPVGIKLSRLTIIADDPGEMTRAITDAAIRSNVVIVSGGLGPTTDDLSLEVAAKAFGSNLVQSKQAEANVLRLMKRHGRKKMNPGHKKMCLIPEGSKVLSNNAGAAPGVHWQVGDTHLFFLPGPPREFSDVFERHLVPFFKKQKQSQQEHLFLMKVFGKAESELSELVKKMKRPEGVEVGFRTTLPENHIKLIVKASSKQAAQKKIEGLQKQIRKKLGAAIFSETEKEFPEAILERLKKSKQLVAIAESCTGGLASSLLTQVPGSSKVLDRSFVTYSNEAKQAMLGVSKSTLEKYGAVSEQTAKEMAKGALECSKAKSAVAITGVAGPSGGTQKKPVGTIWFAKADSKSVQTRYLKLGFDRQLNQRFSAYFALDWLTREIKPTKTRK